MLGDTMPATSHSRLRVTTAAFDSLISSDESKSEAISSAPSLTSTDVSDREIDAENPKRHQALKLLYGQEHVPH